MYLRLIAVDGLDGMNADIKDGYHGKPLSTDRVFDFSMDEPHNAYDFFTPASLPGYACNPNNNNGWLAVDDYLLGELEAMVDEQMVVPVIDETAEQMVVPTVEEIAEPVVEAEEEQVITPVVDVAEGQMDAPMIDMEEDLVALFDDDEFEDDASDGFGEEEVWEVNEDWLMAPTTPPLVLAVPPLSVYEVGGLSTAVAEGPSFPHVALGFPVPPFVIEDLSTRLGNLEYGHGQLVQRVNQVSDAETADRVEQIDAHVELGLADRCAAERHVDPAAVDYYYRDEQQGEHTDAVYSGIGKKDCSLEEKTTRTPVVLFIFPFYFDLDDDHLYSH
ncbi:hypothetical protein Tco_0565969 [Tanacetum coccineum]